jgi:hypothetical protein
MKQQHFLMHGVDLVALGEATLLMAQSRVRGCATCSKTATDSFQSLLHYMLGNGGTAEYILGSSTHCPKCSAPIFEHTLVDYEGKAQAALEAEYRYFDVCDEDQDVVFVDESTLLDAEGFIAACEHCSERAEMPFDQLLDAITGCDPSKTEYVICHAARCGACEHDVMEKTLILPL